MGNTVSLDGHTVTGVNDGLGVTSFLSLRYAQPPVRLEPPVAWPGYTSDVDATKEKDHCYQANLGGSEDCLFINVFKPTSANSTSKLPVLVNFFGGGWQGGGAPGNYSELVNHSVSVGYPTVVVSFHYRIIGFGFLASSELASRGNLGLRDQRQALRWINKYISSFGGDPTKVTLFGISAGAISIAMQMLTNGGNTEGLFRAAWLSSGSLWPTGSINNGQSDYSKVLSLTNCASASDHIACLKSASFSSITAAFNTTTADASSRSLNFAWMPRVDGTFLTDTPYNLASAGKIANIPFVAGDNLDEGTSFVQDSATVSQTAGGNYWKNNYYGGSLTSAELSRLQNTDYPSDPSVGSPYGLSGSDPNRPYYKQQASFAGDMFFQAPRRFLLNSTSTAQKWTYQFQRNSQPYPVGVGHAFDSDPIQFLSTALQTRLIVFAAALNPNVFVGGTVNWPAYDTTSRSMLALTGTNANPGEQIITDNYRAASMGDLISLSKKYPL